MQQSSNTNVLEDLCTHESLKFERHCERRFPDVSGSQMVRFDAVVDKCTSHFQPSEPGRAFHAVSGMEERIENAPHVISDTHEPFESQVYCRW